jgi:hypothetical protein
MLDRVPRRLGQTQRRLKFVGLRVDRPSGGRCGVEVALEREEGRRTVCRVSGLATEAGIYQAAATATAAALGQALDAGPDAFDIVDIKRVPVFDGFGLVIAIRVRTKKGRVKLVGFGLLNPKKPALAGVLAVLHGTNRFVSAFLTGKLGMMKKNQ